MRLIKDVGEGERLWKALSPAETIYDDWDFRATFHRYQQRELFFIAGYDGTMSVGLLALQYNPDRKCLEFFGSNYMEDNRVLCRAGYEQYVPEFYAFVKTLGHPASLEYIRGTDPFTAALPVQDNKFVLPLTFTTTDDYIAGIFSGETKKKLVKRLRKIEDTGVKITVNDFSDIPLFLQWNVSTYGGEAAFQDRPFRNEIFTDYLTKPYVTFRPRLLTFSVGGQKQAITMGLIYKQTYCSVNRGFAPEADKNLREYVHVKKVADALENGCPTFDAFTGDYGWKERWGCQKVPQHQWHFPPQL